jgi:hypothetical protein
MAWQENIQGLGYQATSQGIFEFQADYNATVDAGLRPGPKLPQSGNLSGETKYHLGQLAEGLSASQWSTLVGRAWRTVCAPKRPGRQALRGRGRRRR